VSPPGSLFVDIASSGSGISTGYLSERFTTTLSGDSIYPFDVRLDEANLCTDYTNLAELAVSSDYALYFQINANAAFELSSSSPTATAAMTTRPGRRPIEHGHENATEHEKRTLSNVSRSCRASSPWSARCAADSASSWPSRARARQDTLKEGGAKKTIYGSSGTDGRPCAFVDVATLRKH
jgi:hypothetical protein